MGPDADTDGSNVYLQVDYEGRPYSVHRYGCFVNEQGVANFRATCGKGCMWASWAVPPARPTHEVGAPLARSEDLSFPMPESRAGQQRTTY